MSLSHTILTFSLAFLMCIFFESPIHGLEKIFLKKGVKKQKEVTDGDRVNNTSV